MEVSKGNGEGGREKGESSSPREAAEEPSFVDRGKVN